jgi:hypothetical protein
MSKIISVKRVANNGLQAELTAVVQISERINVLQQLNKGDKRFEPTSLPRHVWFPVTMLSLKELGVDAAKLAEIDNLQFGEKAMLDITDPKIEGELLTIQVTESIYPDEFQAKNVMTSAKQLPITDRVAKNRTLANGRDLGKYIGEVGYFLTPAGEHIFTKNILVVESQVKHSIVKDAVFVPAKELAEYGATLAEPTPVESNKMAF